MVLKNNNRAKASMANLFKVFSLLDEFALSG